MTQGKKICFVIMGFGKKTDPSTNKTLDLDKTYKNIIKPAVLTAGLVCLRADEIRDSGIIDKTMYAFLMYADLVIADISTFNPNAIYELGIRHAVKPYSTIIIKEKLGNIPFDLNHNRIFTYDHMGEDIGVDEAERCKKELEILINEILNSQQIDSPLYEYLSKVTPPMLPQEEFDYMIADLAKKEDNTFVIVEHAQKMMEECNFLKASEYWAKASNIAPSETYFTQQLAVCTYKKKLPSVIVALTDALNILESLDPQNSNDPETLGITGAIYKNLHKETGDLEYLKRAIDFYGKGYHIRNDYYNGENYALCLNIWSVNETEEDEKTYLKMEAKKTREKIIVKLENDVSEENFSKRIDRKWVFATLANCNYGIGNNKKMQEYKQLFLAQNVSSWEVETFNNNMEILRKMLDTNS